jgi:hypothetical protein
MPDAAPIVLADNHHHHLQIPDAPRPRTALTHLAET